MIVKIDAETINNLRPPVNFKASYAYALFFKRSRKETYTEYVKVGHTHDFMQRLSSLADEINFEDDQDYAGNITCFIVSDWVNDCEQLEWDVQNDLKDYLVSENGDPKKWPFKKDKYKKEVLLTEVFDDDKDFPF
ncbi:GIY-YIG nuclease family protein [Secundilactobacillus folii]|uniref:Bacteriophage T5 Orf172 DNA-binding domain-containing protein n=1 Tax=Secundilactobacillus folii TaxID=2678357 RepID=A0A7X2XW63_9LACO|nr:GIY-YIG nuclease family protein [Secundilactobacillus folii]MTV82655.1 hypothetical protein [Secundilactobacillus folii]